MQCHVNACDAHLLEEGVARLCVGRRLHGVCSQRSSQRRISGVRTAPVQLECHQRLQIKISADQVTFCNANLLLDGLATGKLVVANEASSKTRTVGSYVLSSHRCGISRHSHCAGAVRSAGDLHSMHQAGANISSTSTSSSNSFGKHGRSSNSFCHHGTQVRLAR